MYYIEKEFWISCSHRLENKRFNEQKNKECYGKCNNYDYHGHNYKIILKLKSKTIGETGMIMNFTKIKEIFKNKIDDKYDHHCLNIFPEFQKVPATAENMAKIFFDSLIDDIPQLCSVKIFETEGACAEYEDL